MAAAKPLTNDSGKTFSVRTSDEVYAYLKARADAAGLTRAEFMRLLLSLPITFSPKNACDPRLIGSALLDSPCEDDNETSEPDHVFSSFDGMLSAPDLDAIERTSECSIEDEIDGLNPVWVTPEEVLERGDVEALIEASFLLGEGEQSMPFAVVEKATGGVFASRAQPPMTLISEAGTAALMTELEVCAASVDNVSDALVVVANLFNGISRGLAVADRDSIAELLYQVIDEIRVTRDQMIKTAEITQRLIDTPRLAPVDPSRLVKKKRRPRKVVQPSDIPDDEFFEGFDGPAAAQ